MRAVFISPRPTCDERGINASCPLAIIVEGYSALLLDEESCRIVYEALKSHFWRDRP